METSGLHDDIDHDNKEEDEDEDDDDPHWWWLRQKESQVTQFELFFWESTFPARLSGKPIAEATPKQTAYRQTHQHGKPKQPIAHGEKRKLRFPSCTGPKFHIIVTQTWSKDTTKAKGSSFLGNFNLIWKKTLIKLHDMCISWKDGGSKDTDRLSSYVFRLGGKDWIKQVDWKQFHHTNLCFRQESTSFQVLVVDKLLLWTDFWLLPKWTWTYSEKSKNIITFT